MKITIQKEILIQNSAKHIHDIISDIRQWNTWSPWTHCEPTVKTTATGIAGQSGQTQTWQGEVIGSGKMTITKVHSPTRIEMDLEFLSPWKSFATVVFAIQSLSSDHSRVTWTMNTEMPLFMFFFKNMMMAYMGHDFERGLKMLKEYAEEGTVTSRSVYLGEQNFQDFYVIGKKTKCLIKDISTHIRSDFEALEKHLKSQSISTPEFMTTLSHQHDIPKGTCEFTSGYCYTSDKNLKIPDGYTLARINSHKGLTVDHYGSYQYTSNPWSMAVSYQRGKRKKLLKNTPMYEIYKSIPNGGSEKDLHTQIIMPIK
jgi:hypothetical protein